MRKIKPMRVRAANAWLDIIYRERRELFASPERCFEIEARQPESESWGRPGVLVVTPQKKLAIRNADKDAMPSPVNERPSWRTVPEFPGDEGSLIEEPDADVEVLDGGIEEVVEVLAPDGEHELNVAA